MMYVVSIVPENTEILCRRWVGILRYAPDTLNGFILADQLFHQIHIRALGSHRNIDHLYAKIFCNRKMTVIAWNRAEEFYLV